MSDELLDRLEADWARWLIVLFGGWIAAPFAEHHVAFWQWVWQIRPHVRPRPFVAIWPRGGAKSTSAEIAAVALGGTSRRRYGLYVCETQDQADDHVSNIAGLLESPAVARWYPDLAARSVGKYGSARAWRRNRLRTRAGFTIDALGLDSAARGLKIDKDRPDFMILDDIDNETDTSHMVNKKLKILTRRVLPAGTDYTAVVAIQNLVHSDSVFARLADGRADFFADRLLSGPIPALEGLEYESRPEGGYVITAGEPTWQGQDRAACQRMVDTFGLSSFLTEAQHEDAEELGGMFDHLNFAEMRIKLLELPPLDKVVCWLDPAVTDKDSSDAHAFQIDARGRDGKVYRLYSWERRASPLEAMTHAIVKASEYSCRRVGVETDQGGDTWGSVFREAKMAAGKRAEEAALVRGADPEDAAQQRRLIETMTMGEDKAGAGYGPKVHRAGQMLASYELGEIRHVEGTHDVLERALRRFPLAKPFDLVDAAFWAWKDCRHGRGKVALPPNVRINTRPGGR